MPQQVGRYAILSQLGRGGMGIVYLAEDPLLNRQVAIKTIDLVVEDKVERDFLLDRLLRDARAAAMLSHPNIVCVYDVLVEGNSAFLVMEYIAGDTLSKQLGPGTKADVPGVLKVLSEVAAALDYTHSRGVVHRDVKPANVMITTSGTAKIMDFGIARIADTRTSTPTGMVMGTVEYMAPEQIKGEPLDGRADQFSLAAMAYQMLTGTSVFGQHTLATLTYKIVNESPPPASGRNPRLSSAVDAVLAKSLSKLAADRFASCGDFVAALESAVAGHSPQAITVAPSLPKRTPIGRWVAVASVGVLLLAAAGLAWFMKTSGQSQQQPAVKQAVAAVPPNPVQVNPPSAAVPKTPLAAPKPHAPKEPPAEEFADPSSPLSAGGPASNAARIPLLKGQKLMRARRYSEAVGPLSQAIQMDANDPVAHMERGIAYLNQDQLEPAIADFSQVVKLSPGFARAYNERAICYVRMHDDKLALADFSKAIELNPNVSEPFNGRGLVHLRRGGYRKALADFDAAIRISPAFVAAYQNRARAKSALGDDAGAKADRAMAQFYLIARGLV